MVPIPSRVVVGWVDDQAASWMHIAENLLFIIWLYMYMYGLTIPGVKYFVDSYCSAYFYDIVDLIFLI